MKKEEAQCNAMQDSSSESRDGQINYLQPTVQGDKKRSYAKYQKNGWGTTTIHTLPGTGNGLDTKEKTILTAYYYTFDIQTTSDIGMSTSTANTNNNSNPKNTPTLANYPTGRRAQRELQKLLQQTDNPRKTISQFRTQQSLHHYLSQAFDTTPVKDDDLCPHNNLEKGKKRTTRGEIKEQQEKEEMGVIIEPFQPESVLTFCNHLGVSRFQMHKTIAEHLKNALEEEIDKLKVRDVGSGSKEALLELLKNSWQFRDVPELRGIFLTVMKKLGDETPIEVLVLLARKEKNKAKIKVEDNQKENNSSNGEKGKGVKGGSNLKYEDLLNSLSLDMKRLVWEADFESSVRGDGVPIDTSAAASMSTTAGTLQGENIFLDMIRSHIQQYLDDEALGQAADFTYTASFRDKKYATTKRRAINAPQKSTAGSVGVTMGVTGKLSALANTDMDTSTGGGTEKNKDKAATKKTNGTGLALSTLKAVMGSRPKLLAAIVNVLISEHARNVDKDNIDTSMNIVEGAASLHCTLLADVLLTYGQLPRPYEHVRLLAETLDECVQKGIVSDRSIIMIQDCIRAIFQSEQEKGSGSADGNNFKAKIKEEMKEKQKQAALKAKAKPKAKTKFNAKKAEAVVTQNDAERQFELKLLRKIIKSAVSEMKINDPEGLFLNPVTDEIAPGYSRVIKNPMCIRTIEDKAVNLRYSKLGQYEIDVQLMFENCCRYNIGREGAWFRGEANRQKKKWRDEIMKKRKDVYKLEMNKRRKQVANAIGSGSSGNGAVVEDSDADKGKAKGNDDASTSLDQSLSTMEDEKRKEMLAKQRQLSMFGTAKSVVNHKRKHDVIATGIGIGTPGNTPKTNAIEPLPESKAKKRKKDISFPSMPAVASMLLSDPFVVRLMFDKVLRALKNVIKDKAIPVNHGTISSVLQIIHIASFSRKICAMRGKFFIVPDGGMTLPAAKSGEDDSNVNITESYAVLRKQVPKLVSLLLSAEIDKRIANGDLQILSRLPESTAEEWETEGSSQHQQRTILDLVEGSLVHLLQADVSNETALLCQCPRFFLAINELSRGEMMEERCFFVSLTKALLRHKTKMPHSVRDMIVKAWLAWFTPQSGGRSMTKPVHLYFINLLNEWALLGNLVLPIDLMINLSEHAVKAAEGKCNAESKTFLQCWNKDGSDSDFAEIKAQYERMLKFLPEDRAQKWKDAVGINSA